MTDINHFFSKERLERAAMQDERVRLARELHDGVLQALTGATLQLEALSRLIDENPTAAHSRLQVIERLIIEEQKELRTWIQKLKPASATIMASSTDLRVALETLCGRAELQWALVVTLKAAERGSVVEPGRAARDPRDHACGADRDDRVIVDHHCASTGGGSHRHRLLEVARNRRDGHAGPV